MVCNYIFDVEKRMYLLITVILYFVLPENNSRLSLGKSCEPDRDEKDWRQCG